VSDSNITRSDLPAVVKRAAELASLEGDAEEAISEDEVIRIAAELGLAERHVRQALYEGPTEEIDPSFLDQQMGVPRIMATRAVPLTAGAARRALEDYFVTREYLQIIRRQAISTTFEPADDAVSKVARSFSRSKKHCLASAEAVEITLRDLQDGWTHVRLKAVYPDMRKSQIVGATFGTVLLGGPLATLTAVLLSTLANGPLSDPVSIAIGATAGMGVLGATAAGFWAAARNNYRRWRERSVNEANAVLDRLEKGDELRPPPSPWLRKLQMKFDRL
jgi:hypothetical protein